MRLAHRLGECGVGMDELCDIVRIGLPIEDQLSLGEQFADTGADHVDTKNRTILRGNEFD